MRNDLKAAIKRAIVLQWGWKSVRRDRQGCWWPTSKPTIETGWRSRESVACWSDAELEHMVRTGELRLDKKETT